MWFSTRQQLAKLKVDDLANKFPTYTFSLTACDLGVLLDQELTFAPHLHHLSCDCYYQLRQLRTVLRIESSLWSGGVNFALHSPT